MPGCLGGGGEDGDERFGGRSKGMRLEELGDVGDVGGIEGVEKRD